MDRFQAAVDFLYARLPMYQRVGAVAFKKDLTNTLNLCDRLGNPHSRFKSIHVAGTNGKGSSSHMLAAIFQSAGYRTGLYTSPHLKSFTERIRVNGVEVSEDFVARFTERTKPWISEIQPSFFELTVAMAFEYFYEQHVDIAIVEVGLGGRLDSTNIIQPELSLITNIGWDHMDMLGDTLPKIAGEKAGIIKHLAPVVVSEHQGETDQVFIQRAAQVGAACIFAADRVSVTRVANGLQIDLDSKPLVIAKAQLKGDYQLKNIAGVVCSAIVLAEKGWRIKPEDIRSGIEHVVDLTGFKGRWQRLAEAPLTICDTAHNLDGVREVVAQLQQQKFRQLHIVWGCVRDKDITHVLRLLPPTACYYFCQASIPRALDAGELAQKANDIGLHGSVIPDVNTALAAARSAAHAEDLIFIGGSTFVVAELNEL
ncbi:MAG: bifunctional folylpolyglutamate synthase/dihydrofolate synthase [Cyclobacteriaceae bacterium]|jgi:dihydrofolate synthase/folylpolyglutamate synthase